MQVKVQVLPELVLLVEYDVSRCGGLASQLPEDRLINISHSADRNVGVGTVWYWGEGEPATVKTTSETNLD